MLFISYSVGNKAQLCCVLAPCMFYRVTSLCSLAALCVFQGIQAALQQTLGASGLVVALGTSVLISCLYLLLSFLNSVFLDQIPCRSDR